MLEAFLDEVYSISEDNSSDKEVDKPKKTVPQNFTPVTIMVIDTISLVRLRRLSTESVVRLRIYNNNN
jgi:hypothetical protein